MIETLKQWDRDLFVYLNSIGIEKYDGFWIFITQLETWIPLYILFTYLVFRYYKGKAGWTVVLYMLIVFTLTLTLTLTVKNFVARLRPSEVPEWAELIRVLQSPGQYSFFSGHSSMSFCITVFMVLVLQKHTKWIYLTFLWPILFILSRIYVGVHYPSDIIVGAIVGTSIACLGYWSYSSAKEKHASVGDA